jgi:hypothetical protein
MNRSKIHLFALLFGSISALVPVAAIAQEPITALPLDCETTEVSTAVAGATTTATEIAPAAAGPIFGGALGCFETLVDGVHVRVQRERVLVNDFYVVADYLGDSFSAQFEQQSGALIQNFARCDRLDATLTCSVVLAQGNWLLGRFSLIDGVETDHRLVVNLSGLAGEGNFQVPTNIPTRVVLPGRNAQADLQRLRTEQGAYLDVLEGQEAKSLLGILFNTPEDFVVQVPVMVDGTARYADQQVSAQLVELKSKVVLGFVKALSTPPSQAN